MGTLSGQTVYIAGHTGLIGAALTRRWVGRKDLRIVTATRRKLDLTNAPAVEAWLSRTRPDVVVVAAGRVGGILANSQYPAEFIYNNLMIHTNLIHGAWKAGVSRLLNFGSSCMYPKECLQPMSPQLLMTGKLEPTSEPYALAKWAALSLCASYHRQYGSRFITAIPCTVYGPGDNFDPEDGHVLSALLRKFHEAREGGECEVTLWGSGNARREFLYTDDLTEACEVLLGTEAGPEPVNVGSSESRTIRELAALAAEVVGYGGTIRWDTSRPDGAPEKLLDSRVIRALGWSPRTSLREGLERTYQWFLGHGVEATRKERACASS